MPDNRHARAISFGLILALFVAGFSMDYTVKAGDTLGRIARDHDVSLSDLIAANNIANPNLIRPGQVLVIPGKAGAPDTIHVVARGDTLGKIAATYQTTLSMLVSANNIANPNLIRIGQEILVPSGGGPGGGGPSNPPANYDPYVRSGRFHVVKPTDTLSSIAGQYSGATATHIGRANGIVNNVIYSSTRLFLDGPDFVGKGSDAVTTYTVKSGDKLASIAHAHGVTMSSITSANNITNPNLIRTGQVLVIPIGQQWVCPIANSTFFNDWGFPRSGGRYHEGNDLFAPRGTPVRAPVSGVVEQKVGSLGGNQFNLMGVDGVLYIGGHMESFGKKGSVIAGEIVGYVGTTGNAVGTSPHLHFGMYLDGVVINPYPTLVENGCR